MDIIKPPTFTIVATAIGGRNGHSETSDSLVNVDLSVPKAVGGPGKPNTVTPEHLFAAGYAACFSGAVEMIAKINHKDASKAKVTCSVTMGRREPLGFALSVQLKIEDKSIAQTDLETYVKEAHEEICPYSHATRGNIQVLIEVIGA